MLLWLGSPNDRPSAPHRHRPPDLKVTPDPEKGAALPELGGAKGMSFLPEPLKIPDFRAFWLARLTTTIAQMAMVIVIGWQVYDIARQTMDIRDAAFQLGLIGLVQFVPLFLLTPISGWTADRLDRRYVARTDAQEFGTIIHTDGGIKVKWDSGQTSYFGRDKPSNVKLVEPE